MRPYRRQQAQAGVIPAPALGKKQTSRECSRKVWRRACRLGNQSRVSKGAPRILFNDLVGKHQQLFRHFEAKKLSGLKIYYEIKLGR
jgi:hypothetical protein